MIRLRQRLPDQKEQWTQPDGRLTLAVYQYFRELDQAIRGLISGPVFLPTYTVSTVPSAAGNAQAWIYVSNESGGAQPAFSDGTNWRRASDRAVIS